MDPNEQIKKAGEHVKRIREERLHISQAEAADIAQIGFRTLQNIEGSKNKTSFLTILKILDGFECSDIDALIMCGFLDEDQGYTHDASDAHKNRLEKYASESYSFYFVNALTEKPQRLNVNFGPIVGHSYVGGQGQFEEQKYGCKLISPPDGDYTYLYFSSSKPMVDRALFILPYHETDKLFGAGRGVMISISNSEPRNPTLQSFIVVNNQLGKTDDPDDAFLIRELKMKCTISDYTVRFPRLISDSLNLGAGFYKLVEHKK